MKSKTMEIENNPEENRDDKLEETGRYQKSANQDAGLT